MKKQQEMIERSKVEEGVKEELRNMVNEADGKETRAEVQNLHDRVLIVEQSLKSYHKRLDGMNLNIKTDQ